MQKPIAKSHYSLSQKDIEPELEGSIQPLITDRSPNASAKKPFPWRMLLTLTIGLPAAAIGLVLGGFYLLFFLLGGMDCGGGGSSLPSPEKAPSNQPAKSVSPRS
jgi:hypothetical protein